MDRKECYRLTHPLSKISGYATAERRCFSVVGDVDSRRVRDASARQHSNNNTSPPVRTLNRGIFVVVVVIGEVESGRRSPESS